MKVPATTNDPGLRAEGLIARYGIRDAQDLDIEAIAFDADMEVEYRPLAGCEATLVGVGNHAIATVSPSPVRGRERFSIGHELGHWLLHRGRSFRCRVDDPDQNLASDRTLEQQADRFAAHVLMPALLFQPAVKALGHPGFRQLDDLAGHFETSLLATCIRLADIDTLPVILACYTSQRRRWFKAAAHVPRRWWLRNQLDEDSFAYDLLSEGGTSAAGRKQPAEVWFENDDADDYEVIEHCIPYQSGEVLVLLYLTTPMMSSGYDPGVGTRKYNEFGSFIRRGSR